MVFGHSQNDFWHDVPDGVAQCCLTRLQLNLGEWFLDLTAGVPWDTQILGVRTASTRDPVILATVGGTQGVNEIISYSSHVNRATRAYSINVNLDTIYGPVPLQTQFV